MEKKSEQSVFHTPWTEKSNNNNNNNNKKKKKESTLHVKMWTCEKKKKGLCLRKKGH
jgi:hypothetical protein